MEEDLRDGGGFEAIENAMYFHLRDSSWEVLMRKKEVTIERRNYLQVILLKA